MAVSLEWLDVAVLALAAMAAGLVNAIAGGGTLISFPALLAAGVPPLVANMTNTVALVPGYLGATWAQRQELQGQMGRIRLLVPAGLLGGVVGGVLLQATGEKVFGDFVPYLILFAALLLSVQEIVRGWVLRRIEASSRLAAHLVWVQAVWAVPPVFLAAIYGGYFGAGLSVIVLAVLGLVVDDTLTRLNGLKQVLALAVNLAATTWFVGTGQVLWPAAAVMAVGALVGGMLGGKVAHRVSPQLLRVGVVGVAVGVAIFYLVR
ncbi:MAG: sulfite exporter TauE/SafE family protein [Chloroflexi bacterium]|nr:sulfite exporter TauE/SafE family protein [Chloroflexota bacterium]